MNRNGPNRMNTLMNRSSGSCTNTSASCGSVWREDLAQAGERMEEARADAGEGEQGLTQGQQHEDRHDQERQATELGAPVPVAAPGDEVVLLEILGAPQAGPR